MDFILPFSDDHSVTLAVVDGLWDFVAVGVWCINVLDFLCCLLDCPFIHTRLLNYMFLKRKKTHRYVEVRTDSLLSLPLLFSLILVQSLFFHLCLFVPSPPSNLGWCELWNPPASVFRVLRIPVHQPGCKPLYLYRIFTWFWKMNFPRLLGPRWQELQFQMAKWG